MENGSSDEPSLLHHAEPVFRVLEGGSSRRGIRLERAYWQVLREIAQAGKQRPGTLVQSILEEAPTAANATSLLRVYCLRWMVDALAAARKVSDPSVVANLVRASPGAAFALGLDKRIVAYNQSFLNFVQARLSHTGTEPVGRDLRLTLDGHLVTLADALKANGNVPLEIGFVVALSDRRLRGKLNAVLAPVADQDIILCYVLP
ncbi:MAG: ribbon-helix-helix domain-containing protein [Mesorhizobium sp.]|jgi:predicted DNA-binding ribbon-helix-helix protein|uniref:Ribbon-helix-helix domain-containing protein n=1 Tax=Aquamicrobium soli TaxID=1811518 RepID=A0ABV7KE57_9HYPH